MEGAANRFLSGWIEESEMTTNWGSIVPEDSLNLPVFQGATPLTRAVNEDGLKATRTLLNRGADPNLADLAGGTPLIYAACSGRLDIVRTLLRHRASVDATDENGCTALQHAAFAGFAEVVSALAMAGADLNRCDDNSRSALDYANACKSDEQRRQVIHVLTSCGATSQTSKSGSPSRLRADEDYVRLDMAEAWSGMSWTIALLPGIGLILLLFTLAFLPSNFWENFVFIARTIAAVGLVGGALLYLEKVRVGEAEVPLASTGRDSSFSTLPANCSANRISGFLRMSGVAAAEDFSLSEPRTFAGRWTYRILLWAHLSYGVAVAYLLAFALIPLVGLYQTVWEHWYLFPVGIALMIAILALALLGVFVAKILTVLTKAMIAWRIVDRQSAFSQRMSTELLSPDATVDESAANGVLLLRSFSGDGKRQIGPFDFETLLGYALSKTYPVIAVGNPGNRPGAAIVEVEGNAWEECVRRLMRSAELVVMVPADSSSVLSEIEMIVRDGHLGKTVFVAAPSSNQYDPGADWERMRRRPSLIELEIPPYCRQGFVFKIRADGRLDSVAPLGLQFLPLLPPIQPTDDAHTYARYGGAAALAHLDYSRAGDDMQTTPILSDTQIADLNDSSTSSTTANGSSADGDSGGGDPSGGGGDYSGGGIGF